MQRSTGSDVDIKKDKLKRKELHMKKCKKTLVQKSDIVQTVTDPETWARRHWRRYKRMGF
jgi:hypothetical protein